MSDSLAHHSFVWMISNLQKNCPIMFFTDKMAPGGQKWSDHHLHLMSKLQLKWMITTMMMQSTLQQRWGFLPHQMTSNCWWWLPATLISLPPRTTLPMTNALAKNNSDENMWPPFFLQGQKYMTSEKASHKMVHRPFENPWLIREQLLTDSHLSLY